MKRALIIGAGPAGLTAAYELLTRTDIQPVVVEKEDQVGGLAKTVTYKGNRMDLGGHSFFSKSDRVVQWWLRFLPLDAGIADPHLHLSYHRAQKEMIALPTQFGTGDGVMLLRPRKSRIYFEGKFYDYPLKINLATLQKLGALRTLRIGVSYLWAKLFPQKPEENLEDFFKNRFGSFLYKTFFRDYTQKVWGKPCRDIPASWGAQRIKDLNIGRLLWHALRARVSPDRSLQQKNTSTSLIEQFLYPKLGPGQMWETVAQKIREMGGEIHLRTQVEALQCCDGGRIISGTLLNLDSGASRQVEADHFFSTMPVRELLQAFELKRMDPQVRRVSDRLEYRDFLIVGILVSRLTHREERTGERLQDNWIYLQDRGIRAGRLQIFNNWSPSMAADPDWLWIGVEYFCQEGDPFWRQSDLEIAGLAISEMEKIGLLSSRDVRDTHVQKVPKAYPSYAGGYEHFDTIKTFLKGIENLYPIGRNGMHRYNNSDHSMLTAMMCVDQMISGKMDKEAIWAINTEEDYHESSSN